MTAPSPAVILASWRTALPPAVRGGHHPSHRNYSQPILDLPSLASDSLLLVEYFLLFFSLSICVGERAADKMNAGNTLRTFDLIREASCRGTLSDLQWSYYSVVQQ